MNAFQVTCIIKPHLLSTHEHITHIGNNAQKWILTREEAIKRIQAKTEAFYTVDSVSGKRAEVGVVKGHDGKAAYLKTHADGQWNDNLLALPNCDASCELKG